MFTLNVNEMLKLPGASSGKEPACQCRTWKRHRFDPWVWKIPLEKEMAAHSSILAWRIPWTEEPDMGYNPWDRRVRPDWVTEHTQESLCIILQVLKM